MSAPSQLFGNADSLRFFSRMRRVLGWLVAFAGAATLVLLFRSTTDALVSAIALVVLFGFWLFAAMVERREKLLLGQGESREVRREVEADRAELRMGIGIVLILLVAAALITGVLLGMKWMGIVALLVFLYLVTIGGPFWLAEVLAAGEDARRRPR